MLDVTRWSLSVVVYRYVGLGRVDGRQVLVHSSSRTRQSRVRIHGLLPDGSKVDYSTADVLIGLFKRCSVH